MSVRGSVPSEPLASLPDHAAWPTILCTSQSYGMEYVKPQQQMRQPESEHSSASHVCNSSVFAQVHQVVWWPT
jgi:hypothetical protein